MSTGPSFLPFLEAANALWPLSLADLQAIQDAPGVPRPLREAAEATIFLKDQIGERYSGNELQAALVKLAVRLASIDGLQPEGVQGQVRSAAALARLATKKRPRLLSVRAVVVVLVAAIALVLITVALAVARVPLPGDWDDIVRKIFSEAPQSRETTHAHNGNTGPDGDAVARREHLWGPALDTVQERQPLDGDSSDGASQKRRPPSPSPSESARPSDPPSERETQNRPVTPQAEDEERRPPQSRASLTRNRKEKAKKN